MSSCQCSEDKCDSVCGDTMTSAKKCVPNNAQQRFASGDNNCTPCEGICPWIATPADCIPFTDANAKMCNGSCKNKQGDNPKDCCPDHGTKDQTRIKDQIEHGGGDTAIKIDLGSSGSAGSCKTEEIQNLGLDEFRCPIVKPNSSLNQAWEDLHKQEHDFRVDECTNSGGGNAFNYKASPDTPYTKTNNKIVCATQNYSNGNTFLLTEDTSATDKALEIACEGNIIAPLIEAIPTPTINGISIGLIKKNMWPKLNMRQQLAYLKYKIENWHIDSKIDADKKNVDEAKAQLSKCYLSVPYVDLLKNYTSTDQKKHIILTKKFSDSKTGNAINDPATKKPIIPSQYCQGFAYNNSSCLQKCNAECPDTSNDMLSCFAKCTPKDASGNAQDQKACVQQCYNSSDKRPCPYASGNNAPTNFQDCTTSCVGSADATTGDSCYNRCAQEYSSADNKCSYDYTFCIDQCKNNSQCVLSHADACLLGNANNFQQCGQQNTDTSSGEVTDQGNANYCVNKAYTCKNGSDQYAGGQDCGTPSATPPPAATTCESLDPSTCRITAGCTYNEPIHTSTPPCNFRIEKNLQFHLGQSDCLNKTTATCSDAPNVDGCTTDPQSSTCVLDCGLMDYTHCGHGDTMQCFWDGDQTTGYCSDVKCTEYSIDKCNQHSNACVASSASTDNGTCTGTPTDQPPPATGGTFKCSSLSSEKTCEDANGCVWNTLNKACLQDYSASYLFDNKDKQKCKNPSAVAPAGSACHSNTAPDATCQQVCPETSKCPTASACPSCPCDQIVSPTDSTKPYPLKFYVPKADIGKYVALDKPISAHQMVGPECNDYSYNDDPLTFYCQSDPIWYNTPNKDTHNPSPVGSDRIIDIGNKGEIPVGQTVDDAESWALAQVASANKMSVDLGGVISSMNTVGLAYTDGLFPTDSFSSGAGPTADYCTCDAQWQSTTPVCMTNCFYWFVPRTAYTPPFCGTIFIPCMGGPCAQAQSYLKVLWALIRTLKLDYMRIDANALKDPRSDIFKELTYSRKATDSCSSINNTQNIQTRMMNCTRAKEELISPIVSKKMTKEQAADLIKINPSQITVANGGTVDAYCYGTSLGNLFGKKLTDNWFCAQLREKSTTENRPGQ